VPAFAASLRGEARRDFDNPRASLLRFALEYLDELGPARVVNSLGEMPILDHARHVQIFDDDGPVPVHVPPRHFVQGVFALSSCLEVQSRYRPRRFLATIRALPAAAQLALNTPELFLTGLVAASAGNRAASGVREENPESDVETNHRTTFSRRCLTQIADHERIPFPVGPENEVYSLGFAFERAVLFCLDTFAQLARNVKPSVLEPNVSTLPVWAKVYRVPAISRSETLEPRLLFALLASDVASQGFIQQVGKRLYRACGDMSAATASEPSREGVLEKKLAGLVIVVCNLLKHFVVQMARLFEASHQRFSLAAVRVESVLERFEHCAGCIVSAAMLRPFNWCISSVFMEAW
jgi:hypothetical protein